MSKPRILVAMSGGVDSSVAARLLQEQGFEVAGATIRTWASGSCENLNTRACCGITGVEDARDVADSLDIPYRVFNFEEEFKKYVVDYFADEYRRGRTPNPCVACNEHIKFRLFLVRARELGYDHIATGHYAKLTDIPGKGRFLAEGRDSWKDQSYVLFPLEKELLDCLHLPVGDFTKTEIRQKARQIGLSVMDKPDSQEICFIPGNDYAGFLKKESSIPDPGPGLIRTEDGRVLGEHPGYYHYTRGQRRGLGVASSGRLYVIRTDPEKNEVIVGEREDVMETTFTVARMNWFETLAAGTRFQASVKIRAQHKKAPARVEVLETGKVRIGFADPQDAITPGQGAVIYENDRILGGGWIESVQARQEAVT